jgi:hypothetical protein
MDSVSRRGERPRALGSRHLLPSLCRSPARPPPRRGRRVHLNLACEAVSLRNSSNEQRLVLVPGKALGSKASAPAFGRVRHARPARGRARGGSRRSADRGTGAGGVDRAGEALDVVGAVVTAAVDEERGCPGDVALIGASASSAIRATPLCRSRSCVKRSKVQSELAGVGDQIVRGSCISQYAPCVAATSAAPTTRTAALPVSVRRNARSGVSSRRSHNVRSVKSGSHSRPGRPSPALDRAGRRALHHASCAGSEACGAPAQTSGRRGLILPARAPRDRSGRRT